MPHLKPSRAAALLFAGTALISLASACGNDNSEPDNAVLDAHFNKIIADEEAERSRLVEEARDREDVREKEMEERSENYAE